MDDKYSFSFNETEQPIVGTWANGTWAKGSLANGLYIHFPCYSRKSEVSMPLHVVEHIDCHPNCNGTCFKVFDLRGQYQYKYIHETKTYGSNDFNMQIYTSHPDCIYDNDNTSPNIKIVYKEDQKLKSSNPYTVQTINTNVEEKDNTERPIEETEFNFGLIISLSVSGIILITLTIVMIVKYIKKRNDVDKTMTQMKNA